MEFNTIDELAALMTAKVTTTRADLYEEVKNVLRSLHIPDTETSRTDDRWRTKYGREEQWRVFANHQRCEE
jgi:predicted transcriptional regulator